jgi:hypothetical protein
MEGKGQISAAKLQWRCTNCYLVRCVRVKTMNSEIRFALSSMAEESVGSTRVKMAAQLPGRQWKFTKIIARIN